jgi:hypothetical protein
MSEHAIEFLIAASVSGWILAAWFFLLFVNERREHRETEALRKQIEEDFWAVSATAEEAIEQLEELSKPTGGSHEWN